MSSASRGLAPREGLESLLMKMGRTGLPTKPRRGPQAGKSGDPRSQNADSSPRAQGALGLGFEAKPKVKCRAPRDPKACSLGRRVAVDWTWASPLLHAASATARLSKGWRRQRLPSLLPFALLRSPFLRPASEIPRSASILHRISDQWHRARSSPPRCRLGTSRLLKRPTLRRRASPPRAC